MSQVQVCVRVRPLSETELQNEQGSIIHLPPSPKGSLFLQKPVKHLSVAEQQDKIRKREVGSTFSFDRVFDSSNTHSPSYATQDDVFEYIGKKVVDTAFNAFNCTVFAYGQTGSGKTFTLMGSHIEGSEDRGIVPRTCEHLFREIMQRNAQSPDDAFSRYKVEISFLEIYNEKVRDLLLRQSSQPMDTDSRPSSAKKARTTLRVREHPKEGVIVEGLSRHIVNDYEAVEDLIKQGNAIRISGATHIHEHSSRSHAIFTIHFVQAEMSDDGIPSEKVSKINLVDLAGSERADPASDYNRERFKEGININQSLVSLGNVIDSLAEVSQQSSRPNTAASAKSGATQPSVHIPYRASILTFLLRDSLGGNAFTTMIATISPSSSSYNETVSTLRYASRTQVIKNKPVKNEDPQIRLIKDLKNEVDRLKKMLGNKGALGSVSQVLEQKVTQGQEEIDNLTQQWAAQWDRQKLLLQDSVTHDTTGLTVNSDFPHLVGFPNATSRNKAFVVYQLCDGAFTIGSGDHEIGVFGTPSDEVQGVIRNENGVVTLVPYKPNQFQINSIDISGKAVLYSGCLVQLGPSNIFRYWDPKVHNPSSTNKLDESKQNGTMTDLSSKDGLSMEDDRSRSQFPEFTRPRGLDRASSVMSFQTVDMEESIYDPKGRMSEKTQSMASLLSNQDVLEKMALADSLAEKLNEANQTIQSLQEEKQNKDAEDEEKRIALEDLQFNYQEQICEHQDKIEELLRSSEAATEKAEAEIAHLQQKYDEKMRKEKASLDEEIMKLDKLMNQIYAKKKTAKTTMARSNLEKEEIDIMGKLKNLKEREKKMKESLRSIENQIREKEKKLAAKKKKFEEKLLKMETELHSIKAQYLDRHMRTWSSNRPTSIGNLNRSSGNLFGASNQDLEAPPEFDPEEENLNGDGKAEKTVEVEGELVKLRSKPGRSTADNKAVTSAQGVAGKPTFSQLLERRRKEREAAGEKFGIGDKQRQQSCNMINIAIGEDDEGKPMYLKISLKGSGELLDDPEQSSASHNDQKSPSTRSKSLAKAKERALSMDLADLCKLTTFQEINLKEPQRYDSGDNLLVELPSESGRNIMLQRFMNDLGRASVSDVRSNFGYSQERLVPSTSETNLRIERHCEAGVQVVSPSSSCDTLVLEKAMKAKVVYHEVKLRVDGHLHIREPLNIASSIKVGAARRSTRSVSDYESISTATQATSSTNQISGDSVLGAKSLEDDKKVMKRIINGPNVFRPVSQNITAYPISRDNRDNNSRKPRPKSMNLEPEFNEENQENEWGFSPITRSSSGAIRKPFEIKQTEGHTARIGPKVMLTVTPPVTVTAIPGHMLSERPHLIPKNSGNSQTPSGSSKFLKMRRDLQSRQKPTVENSSSIRSDPRAFSVISSREDLREANSMQLKQRLYSNQPFLVESAISNDSHGELEARQSSTAQQTVRSVRTFNVDKSASRENDLEVAQYTEETATSGFDQVRRRLNPNKTKMFGEKRMSWPVNKQEKLTAEMESQPLFIKEYYTSEDSVFKAGSEYAAYERLFDPENIPEQTEKSSTCDEAEPTYFLDKRQKMSEFRNSETTEEVVYSQEVVTRDPPQVYQMPNYDSHGTETEEVLEDENYSMGIYIETKSLGHSTNKDEPDSSIQARPRPNLLSAEYFKFPSPTRVRSSSFNRLSSNRDVSRISRTPSEALSNSRSYLASESGAYRHVEETFTTESVVTKGQEKRTKSGRIIGKWKLVKKKEKNLKGKENYLSTIEVPLNAPQSTPKKIKFDKALSTSGTSINSLKKMRNQGSSPITFLQEKKLQSQSMQFRDETLIGKEAYSRLKLKHAKSLSRLKLQSENFNRYPDSPITPSSSIATQTACEISTQTPSSFGPKSPQHKVSEPKRIVSDRKVAKSESLKQHLYSTKEGHSRSSLRGGMRTTQYKVTRIKRVSDSSEKGSSSDDSMRRKKSKHGVKRKVRSKQSGDYYTENNRKNKKRKHKRRERYSRSSNSSSPFSSDSEPKKSWSHREKKKLKDAMTNTVNEIGIQTEERQKNLSGATNTCVEIETQTIQKLSSELQCDAQMISSAALAFMEKTPSCESVQTLTFKSTPAFCSGTQNMSKIVARERPASLENLPTAGGYDRNRKHSTRRKIYSNPMNEAKRKVFEFMMSCPSNKVEEYLQLLHAAGVPGATLQKFLKAIQNSQPFEIPTEVMQYFETSSMGTDNQYTNKRANQPVDQRNPIESLINLLTFAPFPASLHIASDFLKGVQDISEDDKNKILDGILKQDPQFLPTHIDERFYLALENAIGTACNDDVMLDTDTTSILESENASNLGAKSRRSSNALSQWSPFGSLTIPELDKGVQTEGASGDISMLKSQFFTAETQPKMGKVARTPWGTSSLVTPNSRIPEFLFDESYNIGQRLLSRGMALSPHATDGVNESPIGNQGGGSSFRYRHKSAEAGATDYNEQLPLIRNKQIAALAPGVKTHLRNSTPRSSAPPSVAPNHSGTFSSRSTGSNIPSIATPSFDENEVSQQTPGEENASNNLNQYGSSSSRKISPDQNNQMIREERILEYALKTEDPTALESVPGAVPALISINPKIEIVHHEKILGNFAEIPLNLRDTVASQILINLNPESRTQLLTSAGAVPNNIAMVEMVVQKGNPEEVSEAVATLIGDSTVEFVLEQIGKEDCMRAVSQIIAIQNATNDDITAETASPTAFSDEPRSEESITQIFNPRKATEVHGLITVASKILLTLNKVERNYWLDKLGLYDVVKNEIKEAIEKGDIEKLKKVLPEESSKYLIDNFQPIKVKEGISAVLKEPNNPLASKFEDVVVQTLIEDPPEMVTEILSATPTDPQAGKEIVEAVGNRDSAKLKMLLSNEIIETFVAEMSSDLLIETLKSGAIKQDTSTRSALESTADDSDLSGFENNLSPSIKKFSPLTTKTGLGGNQDGNHNLENLLTFPLANVHKQVDSKAGKPQNGSKNDTNSEVINRKHGITPDKNCTKRSIPSSFVEDQPKNDDCEIPLSTSEILESAKLPSSTKNQQDVQYKQTLAAPVGKLKPSQNQDKNSSESRISSKHNHWNAISEAPSSEFSLDYVDEEKLEPTVRKFPRMMGPPQHLHLYEPSNLTHMNDEPFQQLAQLAKVRDNSNDLRALQFDEKPEPLTKPEDSLEEALEAITVEAEYEPPKEEPVSLTPQKIIASVILDLEGEEILGLISDLEPEMQNDILDAVIGKDIEKIAKLTDEQTANEMLGSIDPFEMANVIVKAQERFAHPEKLLQTHKIEDTNEFLMNLASAYQRDIATLKDILARLDVDLATKIYETLAEDDLIAAKALLYGATVQDLPILNKVHALSDSALVKQKPSEKFPRNLVSSSKSESELARKPEGDKSVSKEVLGEFYDQAQNMTGSDAKVVYVDIPVPENTPKVPSGEKLADTQYNEDTGVEIPQELIRILSKYVPHEQVIDLYNNFLHNPDAVAQHFEREVVENLFNDVEAFELEEQERTNALFTIAANTLQSLSEQEEMDDLVEKLQQLIPDVVSTFCEYLARGEFIQAAHFLPAEILEEMMEERHHNLSYTNDPQAPLDDSSYASSKPTVPVIEEEENEEESAYENVKAFGILKKDEQSNSMKNLQVKFDPQVYEFDVTNPSFLETNESSSKDSSFVGEGEPPSTDHPKSIDDALYNLTNKSDLQDLTKKIAALEAKMDTIEIKESFEVEQEEPWYDVLLSTMGQPDENFLTEVPVEPATQLQEVETKEDLLPVVDTVLMGMGIDVDANTEEVEIDWEEFMEKMRRLDECSSNSNESSDQKSEKLDFNEDNLEILREIDRWEREEQNKEPEMIEELQNLSPHFIGSDLDEKSVSEEHLKTTDDIPLDNNKPFFKDENSLLQGLRSEDPESPLKDHSSYLDNDSKFRDWVQAFIKPRTKFDPTNLEAHERLQIESSEDPKENEEASSEENRVGDPKFLKSTNPNYDMNENYETPSKETGTKHCEDTESLQPGLLCDDYDDSNPDNFSKPSEEPQFLKEVVSIESEVPTLLTELEYPKAYSSSPEQFLKPEKDHSRILDSKMKRSRNLPKRHDTLPCILDKTDKVLEAELHFCILSPGTSDDEKVCTKNDSPESFDDEGKIISQNSEELNVNDPKILAPGEPVGETPIQNKRCAANVDVKSVKNDSNEKVDGTSEPPKEVSNESKPGLAQIDQNDPTNMPESTSLSEESLSHDQDKPSTPLTGEKVDTPRKDEDIEKPYKDEPYKHEDLPRSLTEDALKPTELRFVDPTELQDLLKDIWPNGEPGPLDDEGYIEVADDFVQVIAVSKPENVDNKPFNSVDLMDEPLRGVDLKDSHFKTAQESSLSYDGQPSYPEAILNEFSPEGLKTESIIPNTDGRKPPNSYGDDSPEKPGKLSDLSELELEKAGTKFEPEVFPYSTETEQYSKDEELMDPIDEDLIGKEEMKMSEREPSIDFGDDPHEVGKIPSILLSVSNLRDTGIARPATQRIPENLGAKVKEDHIKPSKRLLPQIPIFETEFPSELKTSSDQDPHDKIELTVGPTVQKTPEQPKEPRNSANSDEFPPNWTTDKTPGPDEFIHFGSEAPNLVTKDENFESENKDDREKMRKHDRSDKYDDDEYFLIRVPSDCNDETLEQIQQYFMEPETLWKLINGETPIIELGEDVDIDNLLPAGGADDDKSLKDDQDFDDTIYLNELEADVDNVLSSIQAALQPLPSDTEKLPSDLGPGFDDLNKRPASQISRPTFTRDENNNALQLLKDGKVPSFDHDGMTISSPTGMFTTQLNINIDVRISSDDLSSSEHVQKSDYTSRQSPSSEKAQHVRGSVLKSYAEDHLKTTETQTINISDQHNELLEAVSDEHMDLIEFKFLPGVTTDASVEELELLCSKTVGEVNGLLNIADQISPPSSPVFTYQPPAYQINNFSSFLPKDNPTTIPKQPVNTTGEKVYPGYKPTEKRQLDSMPNFSNNIPRSPNSTLAKYRAILPSKNSEQNGFSDKNAVQRSKHFMVPERTSDSKIVKPVEQSIIPLDNGSNIAYRSDAVFSFDNFSPNMQLETSSQQNLSNFPKSSEKNVKRPYKPLISRKYFKIPLPNRDLNSKESQTLLKWNSHYNLSQPNITRNILSKSKNNLIPQSCTSSSTGYYQADTEMNPLDRQFSDLSSESGSNSLASNEFYPENMRYGAKNKPIPFDHYPRVSVMYAGRLGGPTLNLNKPLKSYPVVAKTEKPSTEPGILIGQTPLTGNVQAHPKGLNYYNPFLYQSAATYSGPHQGGHLNHMRVRPTDFNAVHGSLSPPDDDESVEHRSGRCALCLAEEAELACTGTSDYHEAECPLCVAERAQAECTCSESQDVSTPCLLCDLELTI